MLSEVRNNWSELVNKELHLMQQEAGIDPSALVSVSAQVPPKPELGDLAYPLFTLARGLKKAPPVIAAELKDRLEAAPDRPAGRILTAGPYLNIAIDTGALALAVEKRIRESGDDYGKTDALAGKRIMVEFSCPNTNKPLHLGHMRNDSLGESISAILKANGAQVMKVNLINYRGVHIC